ncbi:MAG: hypothetical protein AAFN74_10725, partial [Myxococcota bacterium]
MLLLLFLPFDVAANDSVEALEARLDASTSRPDRLAILSKLVSTLWDEDPGRARDFAIRAFELVSPENPRAKARYARLIGVTHHLQSDLAQALSMYERSVALCGDDEPACLGTGYRHMALIYMSRGDYLSAWDLFGRAEQACRDSTDRACTDQSLRA